MQVKTSLNLNLYLRDEVKMICGTYGAKNLSALVNGFFYYLCHLKNPQNGVDIERCMRDCLAGTVVKSKNPQVLADERKAQAAFSFFEDTLGGDPYLYVIRKRGLRNILLSHGAIHDLCVGTYDASGVVVLEDDMRRYLREWYENVLNTPRFEAVELDVLKSGGIFDSASAEDKKGVNES